MSLGKKIALVLGSVLGVLLVVVVAFGLWANGAAEDRMAKTFETHRIELEVPMPLSAQEVAALRSKRAKPAEAVPAEGEADAVRANEGGAAADPVPGADKAPSDAAAAAAPPPAGEGAPADAVAAADAAKPEGGPEGTDEAKAEPADPLAGVNLEAIARKRAIVRGRHLVEARYACVECHGKDFAGGTMMDAMPVFRLFGPNLTMGEGSVTKAYTVADWDRAVRHGVLPNGQPAAMPSEDYFQMSDEELSDIIAYIRSLPPVDKASRPREMGPIGKVLLATKQIRISAEHHPDHHAAHAKTPPKEAPNAEFGKHLANVCVGCHRTNFAGGPIVGGDPAWPPAKNITMHQEGLAGWTYEDFLGAMRDAKSKDGTPLRPPMALMGEYAKKMTDTELRALWAYIESVPPVPSGT